MGLLQSQRGKKIVHDFGGTFVLAGHEVSVCLQGDRTIFVAEAAGDRFDVHALFNQERGMGVAEAMQGDSRALEDTAQGSPAYVAAPQPATTWIGKNKVVFVIPLIPCR